MKNNIVDFQSIKKKIDSSAIQAVNDESFSKNKKSISFLPFLLPLRYALAVSLYLIVVIPLGIIAALRLLFQILGGVAVMGLTIVWFMGANVSGYAVLAAWCALSLCGCADQLFTWWTESRFAFRLFGIGTGSTDRS
ncbi:hypothetical protein LPD88_004655 [Salmonella enterica]|nr:hypothetical protein [Salmonella enterica]